ncbi:hypothetical protein [Streptococcus uberis]|uniref:hypothetical protein n=1 Tax=Streptococcus uberis TaxID=1349 RepID=UPI001939890F|nr:hypothetical protein [Streptococcus uberis]
MHQINLHDKIKVRIPGTKKFLHGAGININEFRPPEQKYAVVFQGDSEVYFFGKNDLEVVND